MAMLRIPESRVSPSISPPAFPALPDRHMSSSVADSARQRLDSAAFGQPIRWRAHGSYALKGFDEALEIREAGLEGVASVAPPVASEQERPPRAPASYATGSRNLRGGRSAKAGRGA